MATVTGYVERIKYRNEDNGYSVLSVADGGEEYILVGTFPYISEGERIEATGRMVEHSIYGEQLAVESYEIKAPEDTLAIERYLGSGAIKGIGAALAKRIVKKFKADFKAKYGTDVTLSFSATAYDAALVICQAILRAGSTDKAAIVEQIKTGTFDGVTSTITFDDHNDPIKSAFIMTFDESGNKSFIELLGNE